MEPLTAFFILEGFLFEGIGIILIANSVFYTVKWTSEFQEALDTAKYFRSSLFKIKEMVEKFTGDITKLAPILNEIEPKLHNASQNALNENQKRVDKEIKKQKKNNQENKVIQGTAFLLGGLILQAISILPQL